MTMTQRYYKATDGEITVFRATTRVYAAASWHPVAFYGRVRAGSHPVQEITRAEYEFLQARKMERLKASGQDLRHVGGPQESWIVNADGATEPCSVA